MCIYIQIFVCVACGFRHHISQLHLDPAWLLLVEHWHAEVGGRRTGRGGCPTRPGIEPRIQSTQNDGLHYPKMAVSVN